MRILFLFIMVVLWLRPVEAENCRSFLNSDDIARVRESKPFVRDVDARSLGETIEEIEKAACPPMDAVIYEAMARTYNDIATEQKVNDKKRQDWLYSKIKLNMAYLQLTGGQLKGDKDPLNRLIRWKLKEYLTDDVLTDPRFFHEVEELLE